MYVIIVNNNNCCWIGPLVTMMGKMVKNMIYFVVLLLVVLMSFGVSRQAILNPNAEPKWRIVRDVRVFSFIAIIEKLFYNLFNRHLLILCCRFLWNLISCFTEKCMRII